MATTDQSFTQTNVGERMSRWGGEEATGYLPPNAGQAGTARHRTERWEPQAEGKQQEGTFKPLVRITATPKHGKAHRFWRERHLLLRQRTTWIHVAINSVALWNGLCSGCCKHDPLWKATAQGQSHQCWGGVAAQSGLWLDCTFPLNLSAL